MFRRVVVVAAVVFVLLVGSVSACQPKIVEVTRIVEGTPRVVEKRVEVTREVTKFVEKPVTVTPVPTATPTVTPVVIIVEKVVTATDRPSATSTPVPPRRSTVTPAQVVGVEVRGIGSEDLKLIELCYLDESGAQITCAKIGSGISTSRLSRKAVAVLVKGTPDGQPWDRVYLKGGKNPIPIVGTMTVVEFAPIAGEQEQIPCNRLTRTPPCVPVVTKMVITVTPDVTQEEPTPTDTPVHP